MVYYAIKWVIIGITFLFTPFDFYDHYYHLTKGNTYLSLVKQTL